MPDNDNTECREPLAGIDLIHAMIDRPYRSEAVRVAIRPRNAATEAQARTVAEQLIVKYKNRLPARDALKACWKRLPHAQWPEERLTYQRLIHELTTLLAWAEWDRGRDVIAILDAREAERQAVEAEQAALQGWGATDSDLHPESAPIPLTGARFVRTSVPD